MKPTGHASDVGLLVGDDDSGEVGETVTLDVVELELVIKVELADPEAVAVPPAQETPGK